MAEKKTVHVFDKNTLPPVAGLLGAKNSVVTRV
jgi:hypothetical protein